MRWKIVAAMLALLIGLSGSTGLSSMFGAASSYAQKSGTPAKASAQAPAKKPAAAAPKKTTTRRAPARARRRPTATRRAPVPANQRVPSKDRYTEIQQALAVSGHFTGEPNGQWKQDSIDALRSFQAANGFEPTGKIDSRSLIKLGLGPHYDAGSAEAPATGGTRTPG